MAALGVGIIGAGNISTQYLQNLTQFPDVDVRVISDVVPERAKAQAETFGIAAYGDTEHLLAQDDVDIVVNLTIPAVHAEVGEQIVQAGKHTWSEKPLTTDRASARRLLDTAAAKGLRVACAPDTVLCPGVQTALRAIARGDIGEPLTATSMFHVRLDYRKEPSAERVASRERTFRRIEAAVTFQADDWGDEHRRFLGERPATAAVEEAIARVSTLDGLMLNSAWDAGVDVLLTPDDTVLAAVADSPPPFPFVLDPTGLVAHLSSMGSNAFDLGTIEHAGCRWAVGVPFGDSGKWVPLFEAVSV